jgi:NADH dehydrogenase
MKRAAGIPLSSTPATTGGGTKIPRDSVQLTDPKLKRKRVVIIGAGFAGLQVVRGLARAPVDVVVIDRENHHVFQPLLYQVATAGLSATSIAVPIRSVLRKQSNARVLLAEATAVDLPNRTLQLGDGDQLDYDYLVVAAGAESHYFGRDEWAENATGLKNVRDALSIREQLLGAFERAEREPDDRKRAALLTAVVIGGGPTGVELAGAISDLGREVVARECPRIDPEDVRVILVEMAERVLTPFDARLSAEAKRQLEELGVEVRLGTPVTEVDDHGVSTDAGRIDAATVCWASGVKPAGLTGAVPRDRS